jgi:hypothetical protein
LAKVLAFMRIADLNFWHAGPLDLLTQVRRKLLAQPSGVDQLLHKAAPGQSLHGPVQQRLAAHAQQGFGRLVGQGAHALAASGGQHHGLGRWSGAKRGRL